MVSSKASIVGLHHDKANHPGKYAIRPFATPNRAVGEFILLSRERLALLVIGLR